MPLQVAKIPANDIIGSVKQVVNTNADLMIVSAQVVATGIILQTKGGDVIEIDLTGLFLTREEADEIASTGPASEGTSGVLKLSTQQQAEAMTDDTTAMSPVKVALALNKRGIPIFNATDPILPGQTFIIESIDPVTNVITLKNAAGSSADTLKIVMGRGKGTNTDLDFELTPGAQAGTWQQQGIFWKELLNGVFQNRAAFVRRPNGTLALIDILSGASLTTEPGGLVYINGYEAYHRGNLTLPSQIERTVVLGIGGSVGLGLGSDQLADQSYTGYFYRLAQSLGNSHTLINQCKPGARTLQFLDGSTYPLSSLLATYRPRFVLLMFSLADEFAADSNKTRAAQTFLSNLATLIATCDKYNAQPVLVTPHPYGEFGLPENALLIKTIRRMSSLAARLVNINALLNDGAGKWNQYTTQDGSHPRTGGHQYIAATIPREYVAGRRIEKFPRRLDRSAANTGVKITSATAAPPIYTPFNYQGFSVYCEIRKPTTVGAGSVALLGFLGGNIQLFRLRYADNKLSVVSDTTNTVIVQSNVALGDAFLGCCVTYNHLTGGVTLYLQGIAVGIGAIGKDVLFDRLAIGGRSDGANNAVGYFFRNYLAYTVPLEAEQVADIERGWIPQSSLLVCSPLSEGNPTYAGQRFENLTGLKLQLAAVQDDDEVVVNPPDGDEGDDDNGDLSGRETGQEDEQLVDYYTDDDDAPPPPTEVSRAISGPTSVNEGTTNSYRFIKTMSDGSTVDITAEASSIQLEGHQSGDTISGTGELSIPANSVVGDGRTVAVVFYVAGQRYSKGVTVVDQSVAPTIADWVIVGDATISEGQNKNYVFEYVMSDGSRVRPVTGVVWYDDSPHAGETLTQGGQLGIGLNATYNDTRFKSIRAVHNSNSRTKVIQVIDTTAAPPTRQSIQILGDTSINEGQQKIYTVQATLSNGQTETVANSEITWSLLGNTANEIIDTNGLLTALANAPTGDNRSVQVKAVVGSLQDTHDVAVVDTSTPATTNVLLGVGWLASDPGSDAAYLDTFFFQTSTSDGAQLEVLNSAGTVLETVTSLLTTSGYDPYQYAHGVQNGIQYGYKLRVRPKQAGGSLGAAVLIDFVRPAPSGSMTKIYPDDYGLTASSPGRNAGSATESPGYDIRGRDTSADTTPDQGAYNRDTP